MKFKFNFEALLNYRKRLEGEAKVLYFEAQSAANVCLNEIDIMYKRIDECRHVVQSVSKTGGTFSGKASQIADFIELQKIKIETKKIEARELLSIAEEKKETLMEASREYKVIEKLKEKRKKQFIKELKVKEQKKIDEISMLNFSHRRQAS